MFPNIAPTISPDKHYASMKGKPKKAHEGSQSSSPSPMKSGHQFTSAKSSTSSDQGM